MLKMLLMLITAVASQNVKLASCSGCDFYRTGAGKLIRTGSCISTCADYLSFGGDDITELDADVFRDLSKVKQIYLAGNLLTELPAGVFHGLASCKKIYLNSNRLSVVPPGVFDNLISMEWLYLHTNELKTLPNDMLTNNLPSLKRFDVYNNQLECQPIVPDTVTTFWADDNYDDLPSCADSVDDNGVCEAMEVDSCDMPKRRNGKNCYARCCKGRAGCTWNRLTRECEKTTCERHPKLGSKRCGPRCCMRVHDPDNCSWNKDARTCEEKPGACFTTRTQPGYKSP